MGAWGVYPLENDTALDLMTYLTDTDTETLGRMIGLMLNSIDDNERTLGIFLVDVYHNGIKEIIELYDYDVWLYKFHDSKNKTVEFYEGLVWDAIEESIENADKWHDKEARLKVLNNMKKRIKKVVK